MSFGWDRDSLTLAGEVVGVVSDVAQYGLTEGPGPIAYFAAEQWPMDEYTFVLRSALEPTAVIQAAQRTIEGIDPELALHDVQTTSALRASAMAAPRLYLALLAGFGVVGLLVATLGTYGVVAFGVQQRTREIGVRMALGASMRSVRRMIVFDGMRLVCAGMVLGVGGALALGGLLRSVLVGVGGRDPATLITVCVLLGIAALAACLVPAIRASRIDPQGALRAD